MDKPQQPKKTSAQDALIGWGELKFREDALGRDAEEREWQEEGLFYQRRQWLDWKEGERRYVQLKPDKRKPRPMPVSNYFAKTVNSNANQLSKVRVVATPKTDDSATRRAADYAEIAKDAIDHESGMEVLMPLLGKHTALWGMGVTKETIDTTEDQEPLEEQELESSNMMGCVDCGQMNEMEPGEPGNQDVQQQEMPCPDCGSMQTMQWTRDRAVGFDQYVSGKGKIKTEVRPIFEVYLPRDIQNANLVKRIIHRYRKPLSACRRVWGDAADELKSDDPATNTSETRMDILRTLTSYTFAEKMSSETTMITEVWCKWDELPKKLQEAIESDMEQDPEGEDGTGVGDQNSFGMSHYGTEDDDDPSQMDQDNPPELQQMKKYGLFFIYSQGVMLQFGPNPFIDPDTEESFFPFTFFLWDVDPANVYPKGIAADCVPLQKKLNRLDSLIELGMMTNASGKWLWPSTQNNKKPPSGDPSDVAEYDPVGDGKIKPEFVQPSPFNQAVWQYRAAILQDFQQIGLSLGVQSGESPGADPAFRTVAYLGAKASEQLNTQRFLWESAHCLRYKKTLAIAKSLWDEERSVKVAGPNGKFLFESFSGENLRGLYEIDFVPNSSIPKTLDEKLQMLQQMIMVGLLDLNDPTVRQYIYDLTNLEGVNLVNELQFRKAERDLEMVKRGEMPVESPYQDWTIELKVIANFTLTEEFEAMDPTLQSYLLAFCEYCNAKVSMIAEQQAQVAAMQTMAPGMAGPQAGPKAGKPGDPNNQTLNKIPGQTTGPAAAEGAAANQGAAFASSMNA